MARLLTVGAVAVAALALAGNALGSNINTNITTPTTWDATVNPVHVTATIHVQAPLTIADGETVQLDPGVSIIVDNGASLTSQGAAMGILITAFNGAVGGMNGISGVNGSTLSFTNTTIRNGGNAAGGPTTFPGQIVCQACVLTMSGDTVSDGAFGGLGANTTSFSITGNTFSGNFGDGVDIDQNVGTGGPPYNFVFENNILSNNHQDAGQIFSNAFGSIDGNSGSGNSTNALFLSGATASSASVHINGNTIPLGLEGSSGAGAPSLAVSTAATLAIGPGQHFVGGTQGTLGNLSGTLTIDGSTFDSLTGTGGWNGITSLNNSTTTITNTTIRNGGNAAGGPTTFPGQIVCQACNLTLAHTIVSGGAFGGIGVSGTATVSADHDDVVGNFGTGVAAAGTVTLTASIVSGNPTGLSGPISVSHSDILGTVPAGIVGVDGNIALDPLFVSATDFHLQPHSPAIGTDGAGGDMGAIQSGLTPLAVSATGTGVQLGHGDVHVAVLASGSGSAGVVLTASVTGANPQAATPLAATDGSGATSFSYTPSSGGADTVTVFFDENGNGSVDPGEPSATVPITIVSDNVPPVPDVSPLPEVDGQCSATVTVPTATDAVAGHIVGTTADPTSYAAQGTFTVHWSYDDGNGNVSHEDQTVVVHDTIAPVPDVAALPTLTGSGTVTITTTPTATDNCAGAVNGTTTDPLSYSTPGTHVVHWSYDDGHGNVSTQTQTVILDSPPHASAGADQSVNEGDVVTLDASASSDPDPGDTLTYAWARTGGTGPAVTLSDPAAVKPTFTAPDNWTYVFQVTVTDSSGAAASASASVTVTAANVPPTATLTAPASVNEGATFTIALTGLHDVPADQPTLTSSLDCGTATTVSPGVCKAGGTGTVTVKGTVTDKDGGSTTYTRAVTVVNVPPTANAGGPYSGAAGTPIAVHGTATDPGLPADTLTFAWDCDGNGTIDATGADATCTYSFPGTYTATLKVTDHDGGIGTATAAVTVGLPASTAALITGAVRFTGPVDTVFGIISDGHHLTAGVIAYAGKGILFASIHVDAVVVSGHDAVVFGHGVLVGHPSTTLSWRLDLHDAGNPGAGDTLRLRLSNGYDSGTLARVTGNLTVH